MNGECHNASLGRNSRADKNDLGRGDSANTRSTIITVVTAVEFAPVTCIGGTAMPTAMAIGNGGAITIGPVLGFWRPMACRCRKPRRVVLLNRPDLNGPRLLALGTSYHGHLDRISVSLAILCSANELAESLAPDDNGCVGFDVDAGRHIDQEALE
jgi:hypothetical protein